MFDKGLNDVEELERLEDLEKASSAKRIAASSTSLDEYFNPSIPPSDLSAWFDRTFGEAANTS